MAFWEPIHDTQLTPHQQRLAAMIDGRLGGRWDETFRLAESELARNPEDHYQRIQLIISSTWANRPQSAVDTFPQLQFDPILPSVITYTVTGHVAGALHRLGRHEEELALIRAARTSGRVQTSGVSVFHRELVALAALGRVDDIDNLVGELLLEQDIGTPDWWEISNVADELRVHGFADAARSLAARAFDNFSTTIRPLIEDGSVCPHCAAVIEADLLCEVGRTREAYEGLLEAYEAGILAHTGATWEDELAAFAAAAGEAEAAREFLARWLISNDSTAELDWRDLSERSFTRAAVSALIGDRDDAIRLLHESLNQGFWDYDRLHSDPRFESLWNDPEFQEIMRPKG